MYSKKHPNIGEVYAVSFDKNAHEQAGWRPAVIVQNKLGNVFGKNVVVLPITSTLKRVDMITHVVLNADDTGLRMDSMVLCENPVTIPKSYLRKHITTLNDAYMKKIAKAYMLASGLTVYLDSDDFASIRDEAIILNKTEEGEGSGPRG